MNLTPAQLEALTQLHRTGALLPDAKRGDSAYRTARATRAALLAAGLAQGPSPDWSINPARSPYLGHDGDYRVTMTVLAGTPVAEVKKAAAAILTGKLWADNGQAYIDDYKIRPRDVLVISSERGHGTDAYLLGEVH